MKLDFSNRLFSCQKELKVTQFSVWSHLKNLWITVDCTEIMKIAPFPQHSGGNN